ncbi:hypothetical protein HUN08_00315 [Gordonia sp. X0973]|uniref:hypothetical protein n=1 Tax=Gordonia sp. X0973 TaxID=2742602 RepID=UPI000F54B23A|nr:hypothetical protein [Gordonia sp. X0973]QKT05813.1 hypothetical protein HUN08_00315 [Gordonia sp. X0973]
MESVHRLGGPRAVALAFAASTVAAGALAAPVSAAPTIPGLPAPHPAAQMHLADWYGTAWVATVFSSDNGGYVLTHDNGKSAVVLEQRSVKYRKKADTRAVTRVGTPWKRLAIVHRGQGPVWGQWTRLPGYVGKQFRLCRLAPDGKQCTSYSGILVP